MATKNMQAFIDKNKLSKIVSGERLTPEGRTLRTKEDLERSDRTKYCFADGTSMTLLIADLQSAPDYNTVWDIS